MAISARNQLKGKVTEVILGNVMAHITIRVGQNLIDSVITRKSAEELKLKTEYGNRRRQGDGGMVEGRSESAGSHL